VRMQPVYAKLFTMFFNLHANLPDLSFGMVEVLQGSLKRYLNFPEVSFFCELRTLIELLQIPRIIFVS
jgi:hypothetical protein